MRIIAGRARGKRLKTPKGMLTRPTQDRIKESLFNILENYGFSGTNVLDLFSGTGALGLESVSRGAEKAVLVEHRTGKIILDNIIYCGFEAECVIIKKDVYQYLRTVKDSRFDYIFADPPYEKGFVQPVADIVSEKQLLAQDGILIIEHTKKEPVSVPENLMLFRVKEYGDTIISFFKNKHAEGETEPCV